MNNKLQQLINSVKTAIENDEAVRNNDSLTLEEVQTIDENGKRAWQRLELFTGWTPAEILQKLEQ